MSEASKPTRKPDVSERSVSRASGATEPSRPDATGMAASTDRSETSASKRSTRHYLVFFRHWDQNNWQQFTQVEASSRSEAIDIATQGSINSGYFVAVPLSGWKVEMRPQIGQEGCG